MPIVVPTPNTTITSAWGKSVADAINGAIPRELAYAQFTALKSITGASEASPDSVVNAPSVTFDGTTAVVIECYAPVVAPAAVANATLDLMLYEGGVSLGKLATVRTPAAASLYVPVYVARRLTPAAGARIYVLAAMQTGGAGLVSGGTGGAGQYMPGFIRITRAT